MSPNNKNKINMGKPRPSVRTEQFQVKNVVTPDTKRAAVEIKERQERQRARERAKERSRKNREKQKARIIGSSLSKKSEKDFFASKSMLGSISGDTKRRISIALIVVVVVTLGIAIGIFAFMASTSARLSISEEAKSKLVRVGENQPYYMLFNCDFNNDDDHDPDMMMLTRVSPEDKSFIIIQIPVDTYVASSAGGGTTLKKIYQEKGDAGLIESVATFSEIGITHYVRCNADGLSNLIDAMGGIEVTLQEYVDDLEAGDKYIPQGNQTLSGPDTMIVLRSKKFNGGEDVIFDNQQQVCMGLLKAALYGNINVAFLIDKLAGQIECDMASGDLINFIDFYKSMDDNKIQITKIPGYKTIRNNEMVFMIDATAWKTLRTQITYGSVPQAEDAYTIEDIDPSSFTIIIQNGAGIDGAGATLKNQLEGMGFKVLNIENAESNVYKNTLIIYNGADYKKDAIALCNTLRNGRIVNGDGLYNMKSDILIIIGSDYKI